MKEANNYHTYSTDRFADPISPGKVYPVHSSATISSDFSRANVRKPEYRVYEILRHLASGSGGFLSFEVLQQICTEYGVRYQTILKYLNRCSNHGWVTRFDYGYRWTSEVTLHKDVLQLDGKAGNSKHRLGQFALSVELEELLPYLSRGVASFREFLAKKRDILGEGKRQQQIIKQTQITIDKLKSGKKVYRKLIDPHDGSLNRCEVTLNDAYRTLWYYTENTVGPSSKGPYKDGASQDDTRSPNSKTQCLTKCRTLSCTIAGGGAAYSLQDGNTTTIWSKRPVSKEDLVLVNKFKEQAVPEDFDPASWYKTEVVEACFSQSSLSRLNTMSPATNGRYVRKLAQHDDLMVVKQLLVVGKYDPVLARELNDLDAQQKYNLPVKGKYFSVRMSKSKLFKLQKQGVIVDWANLSGSNEEMYKADYFVVQVFQHRYYSISKSKVHTPSEAVQMTNLVKKELSQSHSTGEKKEVLF